MRFPVSKSKNSVSKMIFEALVLDVKEESTTLLASKLKLAAEKNERTQTVTEDVDTDEDELVVGMKRLKDAEQLGNLAWVPFSSWKGMPPELKSEVTEDLEPVVWNGNIYFLWDEFLAYRVKYVQMLREKACFAILKDARTYKIIFNSFGTKYFAGKSSKVVRDGVWVKQG
jgi:hypothetical protein